MKKSTELR